MTSPKTKSRLGRGLSSLIPSVNTAFEISSGTTAQPAEVSINPTPNRTGVEEIAVSSIVPNPAQPRRSMDNARLAELAASLRSTGLIQPIVVRATETGYELIAGERRWRASQLAGLVTIPAIIKDVDSFAQAQMALVENIQRQDLNPVDRALAYQTLIKQLGLTQAELAQRLGEERSSIANYLRLLDLSELVRQMVVDGKLSLGHAKVLAGLKAKEDQERLASLVTLQDLSVRNLERLATGSDETPSTTRSTHSAHISELEKTLSRQLGLRVNVKSKASGKGQMVIHYSTLDEFDQLMTNLNLRTEDR